MWVPAVFGVMLSLLATCLLEAPRATGIVEALARIRVAQPDGVVEIEDQPANAAAQQGSFEPGKELALENNRIGIGQVFPGAQAAPP